LIIARFDNQQNLESLHHIIRGCMAKEPVCQRLFYNRYRGFALKIVFRYIYRYEKANDVVTDGFVKAFIHFGQFRQTIDDEEKALMAWLKRIMINCSIDELRKTNMLPEIGEIRQDIWDVSERNDDADQLLLYKDLVSIVKELPSNYRVVFNLYVLDGYSHSQIAELMHTSVSTSRSSLTRAKTLLQKLITNMEEGKRCRI
jgi:RNA polymerase sigma factor (sigma-70 family)